MKHAVQTNIPDDLLYAVIQKYVHVVSLQEKYQNNEHYCLDLLCSLGKEIDKIETSF